MRFWDLEVVEHRDRIAIEMLVAVGVRGRWHIGRRVAACGIGDAAMSAREVAHLRLPIGVVGRKFMQEDDRCSLAGLLEIEPYIVAGDGIGHFEFPPSVSSKRAGAQCAHTSCGCSIAIESPTAMVPPAITSAYTPQSAWPRRRISVRGMSRSRAALSGSTFTAAQRTIRFTTLNRTAPTAMVWPSRSNSRHAGQPET